MSAGVSVGEIIWPNITTEKYVHLLGSTTRQRNVSLANKNAQSSANAHLSGQCRVVLGRGVDTAVWDNNLYKQNNKCSSLWGYA
jgi:hypothetical protein